MFFGIIVHKANRIYCHYRTLAVNLEGFWRLSQMSTIQMVVLVT